MVDDVIFRQLKKSKYHHPIITDVMFDYEMMLNMIYDSISITERGYDAVIDSAMLKFTMSNFTHGIDLIDNRVKEKGIRVRTIFDITKENIKLLENMDHHTIKHIDGLRGNFGIFDNRAYMVFIFQKGGDRPDQTLWSNSKDLVNKQQEIFNRLWDLATPIGISSKELAYQEKVDHRKKIVGYDKIYREILSIMALCKSELTLFTSTKILQKLVTQNNFMNEFIPLLELGITIKILIDDKDETLIHKISSINNMINEKSIQFGYTNKIGNFNELLILCDDKYYLQIKYNRQNVLIASFSNEEYTVMVQETLFERYWNEAMILEMING
jgi:hypothetical protein